MRGASLLAPLWLALTLAEAHPRVAVCIVGLFRNHIDGVLPGLKAALLDTPQWDADVFVETWTTAGVSRHERVARGPELAKTGASLDPQWSALYGPRLRHVRYEDTPMNASRFFHGVEMPAALVVSAREHYSSTLPNLRKTYQCVQAVRGWEMNNGFRYDAVVKLRPDGACADPRWSPLRRAIRRIFAHGRNASAQPQPFFHGNPWPSIMVSDQTAVGTSDAMTVFADAWLRLPDLFAIPCLPQAAPGCNYQLTDEKLMKVYMMCYAPFDHMPHYCCPPIGRINYDKSVHQCARQRMPGGEDWELVERFAPHVVPHRVRALKKMRAGSARGAARVGEARTYQGADSRVVCPPSSYAVRVRGNARGHPF